MFVTVLTILEVVLALATMAAVLFQTGTIPGMSSSWSAYPMGGGQKKGVDEFLERVTIVLGALLAAVTLILAHQIH
jgi:protein translocase SecG subunit